MLKMLRRLVEAESPSTDKTAVDRFSKMVKGTLQEMGAQIRVSPSRQTGDHLRAEFRFHSGKPAGQILLLAHMDTVWELGTIARMPFRIKKGRAYGPGIYDMKSGIVIALFALQALQRMHAPVRKKVILLLTADEEIGSFSSRPLIEKEALQSDCVLVVEPAYGPGGALKTARKGVGTFEIRVKGRAAHAGVDPEKGASAIVELSRQILRVQKFANLRKGITINAGLIQGGTRTNVIAEDAVAQIDVRIARLRDQPALERKFLSLRPYDRRTRLEISGGFNRPPLERTSATVELFQRAQRLAQPLGLRLREVMVGGGSDGNFTAALGIPTLDGLGAVGDGAHALNEHIVISELPRRAALLARLIADLGVSEL
ncbi:MAG: M20 family metallopeptidase [Acidobacteria bacterium]|nr:M20 family metallopeptidase [Acidobacteriota bacterium]